MADQKLSVEDFLCLKQCVDFVGGFKYQENKHFETIEQENVVGFFSYFFECITTSQCNSFKYREVKTQVPEGACALEFNSSFYNDNI